MSARAQNGGYRLALTSEGFKIIIKFYYYYLITIITITYHYDQNYYHWGRTVRCARAVRALCEKSVVFHHR